MGKRREPGRTQRKQKRFRREESDLRGRSRVDVEDLVRLCQFSNQPSQRQRPAEDDTAKEASRDKAENVLAVFVAY